MGRPGLIPAGAGSTRNKPSSTGTWTAHPRWRGEHVPISPVVGCSWGSSPLARGAHPLAGRRMGRPGLIPAGAGSTKWGVPSWFEPRAHPRWRGEHIPAPVSRSVVTGSSPLARGAQIRVGVGESLDGLIPAGAGSTLRRLGCRWVVWAHPRWRGEHMFWFHGDGGYEGSSPLARGARADAPLPHPIIRLIPAGAGSTFLGCEVDCVVGAHPRWRGEHPRIGWNCVWGSGSSPLARGARLGGL